MRSIIMNPAHNKPASFIKHIRPLAKSSLSNSRFFINSENKGVRTIFKNDQEAVNFIRDKYSEVTHVLDRNIFCNPWTVTGLMEWTEDNDKFPFASIPETCAVFHCNFIKGIEKKEDFQRRVLAHFYPNKLPG